MLFTPNYKLGSVVAGESLIPVEDSRRFLTIDRQLLGLFQVFGNGVITGWEVVDGGGLSVSISPGRGHVSFISAESTDVETVSDLVPNAINYIYAQATDTTRFDRGARYFSSIVQFNSGQQILLAAVTTNNASIVDIDSSVRNDISFIEQIKTLINQHRHRGGADNPSKIDLTQEVMGQLPGFHIDAIDASKVSTGLLPPARIPLLNHGDLLDSGVLTHAQLDSFVRNLSNPNVRLLGELSATNMLQLFLAFKHIWNDVDAYTTNMLVVIPGITPDSFTDFPHTTAVIDKVNHLIQGVPSIGGQLVTTTFRTATDFTAARLKSHIDIGTDALGAFFKLTKPFTEQVVESFDNVFSNDVDIPGWIIETLPSASTTSFKTDSSEKVDGPFSAKFDVSQQVRVQVTKIFSTTADWTAFNEIETYIETLSPAHGKIVFQTLKKNGSDLIEIDSFTLLEANETTVGFRKITRDLTNATRDKVDAIRIYTDTALGWDLSDFIVNIDRIRLNNNLFFDNSGRIRFRLRTPQKSHWAAISWVADTNGGTIQARARTAPTYETFDQSSSSTFSSFISTSGGDPGVPDNQAVEVELAIVASAGKTSTPVIRSVTISYITSSTSSGLTIDTADDFLRATKLQNAAVVEPGDVIIDGRIDTGDLVYGIQHSIQQVSLSNDGVTTTFGTPVIGIDGTSLPLSPLQVVQNNLGLKESSLDGVASVQRLQDRTYLAADTLNDRVVVFGRDGKVIQAFGTNNVRKEKDLYPLSVVYNRDNSILYIAWSTNISLASLDLSKIIVSGAGLSMTLSNVTDKTVRLAGPNNENASANVSPILLSPVHAGELEAFFGDATNQDQRLFVEIDPTAAKEVINTDNANFAALVGPRGLPVFVGNFQFINGLYRPLSICVTAAGNWLICNAKPLLVDSDKNDPITGVNSSEVTSVIELNPSTGQIVFSDNSVDFSLLTLGAAAEINSRYIAVAGIVEGEGAPTATAKSTIKATVGGGIVQQNSVSTTVETVAANAVNAAAKTTTSTDTKTDFDVLTSRRGIVKLVEKKSGRVVFQQETSDGTYAADVQIDEDGNLVTIEKSFSEDTSQGRVVKLDEDGNVFFQFGLAELASPNDVRVLSTGNLIVST